MMVQGFVGLAGNVPRGYLQARRWDWLLCSPRGALRGVPGRAGQPKGHRLVGRASADFM